jgi:hypothetical protein
VRSLDLCRHYIDKAIQLRHDNPISDYIEGKIPVEWITCKETLYRRLHRNPLKYKIDNLENEAIALLLYETGTVGLESMQDVSTKQRYLNYIDMDNARNTLINATPKPAIDNSVPLLLDTDTPEINFKDKPATYTVLTEVLRSGEVIPIESNSGTTTITDGNYSWECQKDDEPGKYVMKNRNCILCDNDTDCMEKDNHQRV